MLYVEYLISKFTSFDANPIFKNLHCSHTYSMDVIKAKAKC